MGQRHAESSLKRLQRRRGIGAIDKQLHLRGVAGQQFASKVRRDIERGIGAAFAHFALDLLQILHFTHYTKTLCVYETVDQLTALDGAIFVENEHCHVFDVVVERVAECNHLDQRREKKEKESQRIAPDDDELLKQNCAEAAKWFVLHGFKSGSSRAERGTSRREFDHTKNICVLCAPYAGSLTSCGMTRVC